MSLEQVVLTETVQAYGETITKRRTTVQDTSKLAQVFVLPGETVMQKLDSLRALIASQRYWEQTPLLDYIADIQAAPVSLGTAEVTEVD